MDVIAAGAGTTKTVFYRYFGDRAGLQLAMGEWAMRVIRREIDAAGAHADEPREALAAMIRAFARLAAGSPAVYTFCDAVVLPTGDEAGRDFFTSVTHLLAERLGLDEARERLWAFGALGFVRACTQQWLVERAQHRPALSVDIDVFTHHVTTWVWNSHAVDHPTIPPGVHDATQQS